MQIVHGRGSTHLSCAPQKFLKIDCDKRLDLWQSIADNTSNYGCQVPGAVTSAFLSPLF